MRVPGDDGPGRRIEQPVKLIGLYPTVLELLDIPPNPEVQGVSLTPLLTGQGSLLRPYVFAESGHKQNYQRTVRDGDWKLIYVPDERDRAELDGTEYELYDLATDPDEMRNLAEEHPEVVEELRTVLFDWIANTGAKDFREQSEVPIDAATEENLRALGYLD